MRTPSRRVVRLLGLATIPVAVVGSGLLVIGSSYSVFSATTSNPSSSWSTGSLHLTDDDSNAAMFNAADLKPGSTGTKCIAVTEDGSLPSTVKLFGTDYSTTKELGTYIDLTITAGTGGSFSSCDGFTPLATDSAVYSGTLADFAASSSGYSSGVPSTGAWQPGSGTQTRVYRITYRISSGAPNTSQSGNAAIGFTWEAETS